MGVRLPMQVTRVRAPVREDPVCRGAAGPVSRGRWAREPWPLSLRVWSLCSAMGEVTTVKGPHTTHTHTHTHTKGICTPMFTAALFTIARSWKQPKCPSTDEWIKKKWYIYTMDYYSAIKRNEIGSFAAMLMDLEVVIQSEVSQKTIIVY